MSTPQVAINGLKRSLKCVNSQLESESSFYTSGIDNLLEIRELASQIMVAANATLARVNLSDDRYVVDTNSGKVDIVELTTTVATAVVGQVISTLNLGNFDKTKVNLEVDCIPEPEESLDKFEDSKLINLPEYRPDISTQEEHKSSSQVKSNFTKEFKQSITKSCKAISDSECQESIKNFANLLDSYFQVRFDRRNDPNNIHKFDRKQFKNYLASFVLAYGKAWHLESEREFTLEVTSWLKEVQKGGMKYTMPPSVAEVFFNLIQTKTEDSNYRYEKTWWNRSLLIWERLWENGLAELNAKHLSYSPEPKIAWLYDRMIKHAVPEADYSMGDIYSCHDMCYMTEFSESESFDIGYKYLQKELGLSLDLNTLSFVKDIFLTYQEYLAWSFLCDMPQYVINLDPRFKLLYDEQGFVPTMTCAKSFIFYAIRYPDKLQELRENVVEMWEKTNTILENSLKTEELEEVIEAIGPRNLDVVDVYLNYLDWYEEAIDAKLHPAMAVN